MLSRPARASATMTTNRRVKIGDAVIGYSLTRSGRRKKTVGIKVARGIVEVAAPSRTPVSEIEKILGKRAKWILEKIEESAQEPPAIPLVSGDTLPYLGGELLLQVEEAEIRRPSAQSDGTNLRVLMTGDLAEEERRERTKAVVIAWYKAMVLVFLKDRVTSWIPMMGRNEMPRVLVREQRARWGSCSSDGTLRFSWRLAMVEPDLVDSVVVHELAHLDVMNHSPAFWDVVLKAMPDALERRKRLAEAGRWLPL